MAQITLNDGRIIGDDQRPYFVAEVNSSHNGNMELAKEMIKTAKRIGCDCVKFQSWSAQSLYSKTYYKANPIAGRIVGKFSLMLEQQKELSEYCRELGIAFASTPYSEEEVDFLLEHCEVPYIKIASMDIATPSFLRYIAQKDTAIVLATGMADMQEIQRAVDVIMEEGNDRLCLLHCISIYPAKPEMMQMNNIPGLRETFPDIPIGFSDHTIGSEIACASIALGSCMLEKHFTLDRSKMGMDNNMATEPAEFEHMIRCCSNVFSAMGTKHRIVGQAELDQRKKMRRSVVAVRDLKEGDTICITDLGVKRPGDGIPADQVETLVGRSVLRDVEADTILYEADVE